MTEAAHDTGGAGQEAGLAVLLRHARYTYRDAIRRALDEADCSDLPPNGTYVVSSIARLGTPLADIIRELGVSKQAAGQLVDTLVVRGYIERTPDPLDRRRLTVTLTPRGEVAVAAATEAVVRIDEALHDEVGTEALLSTRATLWALIEARKPYPES